MSPIEETFFFFNFFFNFPLTQCSLQTLARRQLKIHNNNTAKLEDRLFKTRVLKILLKGKKIFISQRRSSIQLDTVIAGWVKKNGTTTRNTHKYITLKALWLPTFHKFGQLKFCQKQTLAG